MKELEVKDTQVILAHVMQPSDANPIGNVHGGTIIKLIEWGGGIIEPQK